MAPRPRSLPVLPLLAAVAVVAGTLLCAGRAAREPITLVMRSGRPVPVAAGSFFFRPPGTTVITEPRGGSFRFPPDDTYRLFSADSAEIPATFAVNYTLGDPGPLVDYWGGGATGRLPAPGSNFAADVLVAAFRAAARPAAAGLDAGTVYQTEGRALVEALTRELELPRGVEVEITLHSLAMSAGAQRALLTDRAERRGRPVLFIGVDALDWILLEPLMAEGRVPNLTRLVRGGVRGDLRTLSPMLSPLIWTSIATGVGPERHGILDFFVKDPETGRPVPATSSARRVPAFWNIATNYGRSVNVVGWLATWPAESIRGVMVTDRFGFLAYAAGAVRDENAEDVVAPAAALARVRAQSFTPDRLGFEKASRFLDVSRGEFAAARTGGFRRGNLVNNFVLTYATGETYRRIGVELLRDPADVTAVYFEFIDAVGHLFMPYAPPRRSGVTVADFDRYRDAVKIGYVEMDRWIGSLLDAAGDSTIVIVASDHGFLSGSARPAGSAAMEGGQAARWHRDPGVLILSGPGVRRGERLAQASVLDMAPTLLHLAGLPVSAEMTGRVLTAALTPAELASRPVQTIDRYRLPAEIWSPPAAARDTTGAPADAARRDDAPVAPATDAAAGASTHVNLGLVLEKKGDLPGAEREYRAALRIDADDPNARNNLAGILQRTGRIPEAVAIYEALLSAKPDYTPAWINLGICRLTRDDAAGALDAFDRALAREPGNVRALVNRGHACLRLRRPEPARASFRRALELSPSEANAHFGLGLLAAESGDLAAARTAFEETLRLDPGHRTARENLEKLKVLTPGKE